MASDDKKTGNLTLVNTSKPYPNFHETEPNCAPLSPRLLIGTLGGADALKEAFPGGFAVADPRENFMTLHFNGAPGYRHVTANHTIDAIAFRATPSTNHFDIIYMRGSALSERTLKEALADPAAKNLDTAGIEDLAWSYYEKARGELPPERNNGGFYVVATEYAVATWDILDRVEEMTGLKVTRPRDWAETCALAKQHVTTCDCDTCRFATENAERLASRFAPLPLLDADRNVVPRPAATFADTPTTADAAKVSDALSRAQKLGWGNGNPQSVLIN